jgi:spectrin alpha
VVENWIVDRETQVRSDEYGRDLSSVQTLLTKQETFDAGLVAFEKEGIASIRQLKEQLVDAKHVQSAAIEKRFNDVINRWNALKRASETRRKRLLDLQKQYKDLEELYLLFAKKASAFNSWFENAEEDLTDPVRCNSVEEIKALHEAHEQFKQSLKAAESEFHQLAELDARIKSFNVGPNPYTWFTMESLEETWNNLQKIISDRDQELLREEARQKENDALRQQFAQLANEFFAWLQNARSALLEASGTLEEQLQTLRERAIDVLNMKTRLKEIENLAAVLERRLILDNRYTEHSNVGLAQQWDQLEQLALRLQHNLEQQIQARNQSGVSEESLREFSMMFKHFDKNKNGKLPHADFKSCLRALGYDLPAVEAEQKDAEFEAILDIVDPNRDGFVTIQEFMAFMISRETENVQTRGEVEEAFKALASEGRPYITKRELEGALTKEQVEYCIKHMPPWADKGGFVVTDAYDYKQFTSQLFQS